MKNLRTAHVTRCSTRSSLATIALVVALGSVACTAATNGSDIAIEILSVAPVSVEVNQTLVIALTLNNPSGAAVELSFEAPSVPEIGRVATIAGSPTGGEFRWTPLASQVGTHEVGFVATFDGGASGTTAIVTVEP